MHDIISHLMLYPLNQTKQAQLGSDVQETKKMYSKVSPALLMLSTSEITSFLLPANSLKVNCVLVAFSGNIQTTN